MNLLLFERNELDSNGEVRVTDRRATHIRRVLRLLQGDQVRAGCINQSIGQATIVELTQDQVVLRYNGTTQHKPHARRVLALAIPRPKVLSRCLQHAAALGFQQIHLFRSQRVEKSHLKSHKLDPEDCQRHLLLGLEQSRRIWLPTLRVHPLFRPFAEDEVPSLLGQTAGLVACPKAPNSLFECPLKRDWGCLVLGPEGGLSPFEVDLLRQGGCLPVNVGSHPLRVESALSYITGQLDLLSQQPLVPTS